MQKVILPFPINESKLASGSIEYVDFGSKTFKVCIPPKARIGQQLRLRNFAGNIDESFRDQDVILILQRENHVFTSLQRDILIELPIDTANLSKSTITRVHLLDKKYDVKVPISARNGHTLRMKGLAERFNGGYPGDVLLKILERPKFYKGNWHTIIGNFVGSGMPLTGSKFSITFKLPWLFEVSNEWHFRSSDAHFHGHYY
ncbi:DnaJ C-terminal domain-containing protein [Cytophagaceae bacterium DM2B3-1]|uniref:DnaJ C-terminal domain-containing protein n=1 Tax=Xanthocytophaga flava TaxID=3048013 RepID=A0ABT7CNP9_9BACT|nr:DnaJ C-terminal domain-containing protein [Xanthocytophaga flavus]MDJ1495310.1 DnaJ C-terminal domain-containing protein [Xanthocytophaga flavus]